MNTTGRFAVAVGFVGLSGVVSLVAAPELPQQVVSHWNAAGEPDGTLAKPVALALVPALSAALLGLFAVVPRIDPLRENVAGFRRLYDWFVVVVTAYLALVHVGLVAFNLGYEFDFAGFVLAGIGLLYLYVGYLLPRARRNWFVGVRTPWTLSSDEVWDRTHVLGGRLFALSGVLVLLGVVFDKYAVYLVLGPTLLTAAITIVYSYVVYERLDEQPAASA